MFDVNEYFDGKVKSIAFDTDTLPATMGVMSIGEYEFATSQFETMTVVSGSMIVKLPGSEQWQIPCGCPVTGKWYWITLMSLTTCRLSITVRRLIPTEKPSAGTLIPISKKHGLIFRMKVITEW